ncbi:protoglobin domain-containing protein [Pseudovibrio sp. SPO723]|uniref:protoglobin domain-containing protein n=1 Tax=Nesiotobacter zosterae TaxID=392721 RepID=UPI0029C5539D|nr:protoglobin domain-containing protein [Pseudovibrio sp. SPO723]MDX5593465.1 protoglobin domain-containing protein [Pseudovibrio sp. SPO723]
MSLHRPVTSVIPKYRAFLGIDDQMLETARSLWSELEPALEPLLSEFHNKTDKVQGLGERTAARRPALIRKQKAHIALLLNGKLDEAYVASTMRTALAHREEGLPLAWYINSHVVIGEMICKHVAACHEGDPVRARAAEDAICKLVSLDIAVASSAYEAVLLD